MLGQCKHLQDENEATSKYKVFARSFTRSQKAQCLKTFDGKEYSGMLLNGYASIVDL